MTSKRPARRCEPTKGFESLEGRELLTGGGVIGLDGKYINKFDYQKTMAKRKNPPAPPTDRRVELDLSGTYGPGAKAIITLYGNGTLISNPNLTPGTPEYDAVNTHVDSNGGIHVIFDGTSSNSQIIGSLLNVPKNVNPNINEIRDADVSPYDTTGVGTNQMGYINLSRFNLANGGRINLSAGVQRIFINDIGHGTQLDLAALATPPTTSPQNPGGLNSTTTTSTSGSTAVTNSTGQKTITTTVNGITVITTLPTTDQLTVSNYELTGVGGIILPGAIPSTSGNTRVEIQGVELIVRNVNGSDNPFSPFGSNSNITFANTSLSNTRIGNELLAGVDAVNQNLLLFQVLRDPTTFALAQANQVGSIKVIEQVQEQGNVNLPLVGAAVAQYGNTPLPAPMNVNGTTQQVVVVGYGNIVQAYSMITGNMVGWFKIPANTGITKIDGIAGSGGNIYVTDSKNGALPPQNAITQGFNLTASLDAPSKYGVVSGNPLTSPNSFTSKGGLTGVSGVSFIYNAGSAYFDPYTPTNPDAQLGIMKINVDTNSNLSVNTSAKVNGSQVAATDYVMGSVDQNILLVNPASAVNSANLTTYTAQMYNPTTLASAGSITINTQPNTVISGLSESFYPQLFGSSVIDVKGNLKTFSAVNTNNMVLNVNGIANYTRINDAQNTTIVAHPILHLAVSWKPKSNVNIISSARPTDTTTGGKSRPGTRGGVQIVKKLPIIGPLVTPAQRGL